MLTALVVVGLTRRIFGACLGAAPPPPKKEARRGLVLLVWCYI